DHEADQGSRRAGSGAEPPLRRRPAGTRSMSGGHDDEDVDLRSLTPRQREWALSASRLVASLVGKLAPHASEQEREDLLQDGHEGACQAARRFDPAVGARFTSYAHPFIAGA